MINERESQILKLIVEAYIKDAKPVGSNTLCQKLNCSSATIRNEMSYLETLDLIEKTHTSSGRVPSEKGYRYYVDNLMEPAKLTGEDMLKLQTIFNNHSLALSDVISKSMEVVSDITNYAAITLGDSASESRVNKVEAVPLDTNHIIAIIITDNGYVEHKTMNLPESVASDEVKKTVDVINKMVMGTPLEEINSKLEFEVKPVISKCIKQHQVLYNAFYDAFADFANEASTVKLAGTSNIIKLPEFDDTEKIRNLIDKLDDKEIVRKVKASDDDVKIYIGSENEFDPDVTIVKTKYKVGNVEGTIALIGPKRMEYNRAITLLDYIKDHIKEVK